MSQIFPTFFYEMQGKWPNVPFTFPFFKCKMWGDSAETSSHSIDICCLPILGLVFFCLATILHTMAWSPSCHIYLFEVAWKQSQLAIICEEMLFHFENGASSKHARHSLPPIIASFLFSSPFNCLSRQWLSVKMAPFWQQVVGLPRHPGWMKVGWLLGVSKNSGGMMNL